MQRLLTTDCRTRQHASLPWITLYLSVLVTVSIEWRNRPIDQWMDEQFLCHACKSVCIWAYRLTYIHKSIHTYTHIYLHTDRNQGSGRCAEAEVCGRAPGWICQRTSHTISGVGSNYRVCWSRIKLRSRSWWSWVSESIDHGLIELSGVFPN